MMTCDKCGGETTMGRHHKHCRACINCKECGWSNTHNMMLKDWRTPSGASMGYGAEEFEAHGIGSDEKCDYCELPMDYCERLRGVKHSPREGGIGRYKLDCHQCGEMYESCPECDGDICFDCHNDICIFCGCNTLEYAAESFEADMTVADGFKLGVGAILGFTAIGAAFGLLGNVIGNLIGNKEE